MIKIILLVFILSFVSITAQKLEYNTHSALKFSSEKNIWERNNIDANFKTNINIDEFNRDISVNFLDRTGIVTLSLTILEKNISGDGSVMYICKGTKSNLVDKVVIGLNKLKTEMTIMYKCKEDGNCETATFFTNR